jgi:hypothetical protein
MKKIFSLLFLISISSFFATNLFATRGLCPEAKETSWLTKCSSSNSGRCCSVPIGWTLEANPPGCYKTLYISSGRGGFPLRQPSSSLKNVRYILSQNTVTIKCEYDSCFFCSAYKYDFTLTRIINYNGEIPRGENWTQSNNGTEFICSLGWTRDPALCSFPE